MTNPELLRTTLNRSAENLVRGTQMLAEDIEAGGGELKIRQSDMSKFEVGRNLAITPGKVIYQNALMQLIQYTPSTERVLKRPLLIVPPWINKYYVLDLTPEKSLIKWCVDQGLTVFVISWINPDERLAQKGFADYMREGPLEALDVVARITGEDKVNAVGYCVGGTLLAVTLAYMAGKRDDRVMSATFLTTQVDFTHAGDLKVFAATEEQVGAVERQMTERGYLEGSKMAAVRLRSPVLEFRRDANAGGQSFVLFAQLLFGQQYNEEQAYDRQRQDRSQGDHDPDLQSRHPRGSYSAGQIGLSRLDVLRRADAVRAVGVGPHCRRRQSARQDKVSILDGRHAARRGRRGMAAQRRRTPRIMVARLARLDQGTRRRGGRGAPARRRRVCADRGCAGELCETAELSASKTSLAGWLSLSLKFTSGRPNGSGLRPDSLARPTLRTACKLLQDGLTPPTPPTPSRHRCPGTHRPPARGLPHAGDPGAGP